MSAVRTPLAMVLAGGTGGHVYPALAVARGLLRRGWAVEWVGARGGMEQAVAEAAGIPLHRLPVAGLRGKRLGPRVVAAAVALLALAGAVWLSLRFRPSIVLGMGGFVTGPAGLAAWLTGRTLLIHEQNAAPGLTNRLLAPFARKVMEAFRDSFPRNAWGVFDIEVVYTGNPLRPEIAALAPWDPAVPDAMGPLRILVVGGSQGAEALNRLVPEACREERCRAPGRPFEIVHQCGPKNVRATTERYRGASGVRVVGYVEDMAGAYAEADLVIARAGAMTIAELCAAGKPAILVPYPFAVDDHQTINATHFAAGGGGIVLEESEATPARLAGILAELAGARERLHEMAARARGLAVLDATERVVACCMEAFHAPGP